jgi:putative membrane protein
VNEVQPTGRLHPWSWIFYATRALRELALPLIVFLLVRRDDDIGTLVVTGAAALFVIGYGVVKSITFRFEVLNDEIVIRDGVLFRELRHVPFTRIQSVGEQRGLLHRLLDVTDLVLESGSGGKPEAVMRVLAPADAARISALLRSLRANLPDPGDDRRAAPPARLLLTLPVDELITLGVISNRGLVVVALLAGAISQNADTLGRLPGMDKLSAALGMEATNIAGASPGQLFAGLLVLLLSAFVVIRVLSVIYAIFTQHDFTLERNGDRLRVRRGLLTRVDLSGRVSGMERLVLEQTLLHRLFRRCSLRVNLASQSAHTAGLVPQLDQLAPIATLPQARMLLDECIPGFDLEALEWRRLHRSAARRFWQHSLLWLLPASAAFAAASLLLALPAAATTAILLLAVLLVAGSGWYAGRWADAAGYAVGCGVVVWRSGVWARRWVLVFDDRAQATLLQRSPRDRREATVSFCVDVQGTPFSRALTSPFVAEEEARALNARFRPSSPPRDESGAVFG